MNFTDKFIRDITSHELHVIHDDGLHRHLRFNRADSMVMFFDIITWPGCLCYTGDMGTYVFRRLHDMFRFFRRSDGCEPFKMDVGYWAEKLESVDRCDGFEKFSASKFIAELRDHVGSVTEDWPEGRRASLLANIENNVIKRIEEGCEDIACQLARDFEYDGFRFDDFEFSCREYTHRFMWCCHALQWAIATYDRSKIVGLAAEAK